MGNPSVGRMSCRFWTKRQIRMTDLTLTVQATSHPDIIKLEANRALVKGSYEFKNIDEAKGAPLARELFYLPFVKTVYISSNFIALKRFPIIEWTDVQEEVREQVLIYLQSGKAIVNNDGGQEIATTVYTETTFFLIFFYYGWVAISIINVLKGGKCLVFCAIMLVSIFIG